MPDAISGVLARMSAIQSQIAQLTPQAAPRVETTGTAARSATFSSALADAYAIPTVSTTAPRPSGESPEVRSAAPAVPGTGAAGGTTGTAPAAGSPGTAGTATTWQLPLRDARITSPFGMRTHPVTGIYKLHSGTDFAAATGTPVSAVASGTVRFAGYQGGNGNAVVIDHGDGISTLYGHASALLVKPGDHVRAGEPILRAGSTGYATGPHLHLEVRKDDKPMDPLPWLRDHGVRV